MAGTLLVLAFIAIEQRVHRAGVVRFGMADNNQVNLVETNGCFDLGKELIGKGRFNGIDQSCFLLTTHYVRVVGRAIVRRKKLVKNFQVRVPDADPENIIGYLNK